MHSIVHSKLDYCYSLYWFSPDSPKPDSPKPVSPKPVSPKPDSPKRQP